MNFVSYAQNFEDVVLWRALHDVEEGRYLDVGAQDPIVDSVSYAFYKAGWRGIHVEPTPAYAERLREGRPDEVVIEAALTDAPGPIEFYEIPDTGLSTGKIDIARHHDEAGYDQRKLIVPCIRLDCLLGMVDGDLHWMKVDVEGMEADVLRSWGDAEKRPWILVIESTYPNSQKPTEDEWVQEVVQRGYREVLFDGLSRYYLHKSHADRHARFAAPANIFDNFIVSRDHFTARMLRSQLDDDEQRVREEQAVASDLRSRLGDMEARLRGEQSRISALEDQLTQAEMSLGSARASEASAVIALAQREREHRDSFEKIRREHEAAEDELRRKFVESSAILRRDLRQSRETESSTRNQLVSVQHLVEQLEHGIVEAERRSEEREAQRRQNEEQLSKELERHRKAALRADSLIRAAVTSKVSRWRRIAEAFGFAGAPQAWRDLSTWSLEWVSEVPSEPAGDPTERSLETFRSTSMHAQPPNPYLRASSLPELLSWNDLDFVRCAYVTMLGRQPDALGESYYGDRLRLGHSKLELLWQLRRSNEGRRHDPGIAGLDRALKRAALARKPVIGVVVRAFAGGEPDDRIARMHRALTNELRRMRECLGDRSLANVGAASSAATVVCSPDESPRDCTIEPADLSPTALKVLNIMVGARTS